MQAFLRAHTGSWALRARPMPKIHVAAAANDLGRQSSVSVAVVGGGAAGLIAAKELLQAGHRVTIFERGSSIGGVWRYTDEVEDDPLGQGRHHVHSSMYAQLRTNLPREVMGLPDFPFDAKFKGSGDPRQFPGHEEVQRYLEAFADDFGLHQHVLLGVEVQRIAPLPPAADGPVTSPPSTWLRWELTTRPAQQQQQQQQQDGRVTHSNSSSSNREEYDAVVVANGHYSTPRLPDIPGQDVFPGLQMHSHNYRHPEAFRGQTVVLLGASSSGVDIAEEIAGAGADRVYLCARAWENPLTGEVLSADDIVVPRGSSSAQREAAKRRTVLKAPNLVELHEDGSVTLADGSSIDHVDTIMYCTGYVYDFPFLSGVDFVRVEDNRVGPLYQHVFPPAAAPTLSFVGLPWKVVPFPQFQLQGRWIAKVLSGAVQLPCQEEMLQHTEEFYASLQAAGIPVRYTHRQSDDVQWQYNRWLAQQCGAEADAPWRRQLYNACGLSRKLNAGAYRDMPLPNAEAAEQAARDEAVRIRQQRDSRLAAVTA